MFVAGYQIFYKKTENIPEIIQTSVNVQTSNVLNAGIYKFDTMNPIKSQNEQIQQLSKLVFESLFIVSENFNTEFCLAKELTKLDDLTYILRIRENVLFHDGSVVNSNQIVESVDKIKHEKGSIYYGNVENIKNIRVIDEITMRIELYKKDAYLKYNLIFPIVKDENIGTGKYVIDGDILKYNECYWKDLNPTITEIQIKQYEDVNDMYNDFKNANIDIINTKEMQYKSILGEIGFNKKEYLGREYTYIEFNNVEISVRQAIYNAINKNEIIAKVFKSNYYESNFLLDISNWLYKSVGTHRYDIEKSIETLEKGGWVYEENYWKKNFENTEKKLELKLLVESTDTIKNEIAYIIKNQLEKIGIKVVLEKVSKNLYNYYLKNKRYDIIIKKVYMGVSPNLSSFFIDNELMEEIENASNDKELMELYRRLEEEYTNNVPFVVLCANKQTLIYSNRLYGEIVPNWYYVYYNIENWKKIVK